MILIKLSYTFTTKKGRRMVHSLNGRTKVTGSVAGWMTSLTRRTQECKVSFTFNLQRRTSKSFYLVAYSDLDYNITITLTDCWHFPLCCKHGQYLMEPALTGTSFNSPEYEHINCVRMHLQVATLSDISDGNGQTVNQDIMAGQRPTDRQSPRA